MGKKSIWKVFLIVLIAIILLSSTVSIVSTVVLNYFSGLDYYDISGDNIPSVKYVLGERSMSGISNNTSIKPIDYKQYRYEKISSAISDVEQYAEYLCLNEDFIIDSKSDTGESTGQYTLWKISNTTGKRIQMVIDYETSKFTITIEKERWC